MQLRGKCVGSLDRSFIVDPLSYFSFQPVLNDIDISDILETPSYFLLPSWCNKPLDIVHLKKDRTDASDYKQLFMKIRGSYRVFIPVYTDGSRYDNSVACALVFPPDTVISMNLSDSASIFTAEICAIIKSLKEIKYSLASQYIIFTDSLLCLLFVHYMKLEHSLTGMMINTKVCPFKCCQ